ncbi:LrgB family protein [Desnuesiella massiliensis]|uniref:LrgB family protein n=1 Tax=Desnuesiella massiliensis TaxID=1650662 RepID=UPI0006E2D31A|nr:LrgB family protein [Desnuesiella massiliensis]
MLKIIDSPLFGILLSLICFEIGCYLNKKYKIAILNPLLISQLLIIFVLLKFNISYESYSKGGDFISFFLGPATVILAVPLYKKLALLKRNALAIILGIVAGSFTGIICIILLSYALGLDMTIVKSLAPKSVTVPIGVEITKQLNGIPSITVVSIIITGIIGSIIAPFICKVFKIKDKVSMGIAIGTASHALGTTKAMELGETEGAMSSLSIGLAGLITVFLVPIVIKILGFFINI